jgi:hypothetical protein
MLPIATYGNWDHAHDMYEKLEAKLKKAIDEANIFIRANHLFFDEAIQYLADHLMNHPDPDIRRFQERHNRSRQERPFRRRIIYRGGEPPRRARSQVKKVIGNVDAVALLTSAPPSLFFERANRKAMRAKKCTGRHQTR